MNIHEPEVNNCFSIITQVIIEIPKQRYVTILPQFAIVDKSSYHAACFNVSPNAFWTPALKKKHFLWHSYWVKTNQNEVLWSVLLSTIGTLHCSFPKQCFLIASACWASLQKFLKGKMTHTSSSFAWCRACNFKSESVFSTVSKSEQRFLLLSLILWYI